MGVERWSRPMWCVWIGCPGRITGVSSYWCARNWGVRGPEFHFGGNHLFANVNNEVLLSFCFVKFSANDLVFVPLVIVTMLGLIWPTLFSTTRIRNSQPHFSISFNINVLIVVTVLSLYDIISYVKKLLLLDGKGNCITVFKNVISTPCLTMCSEEA